MVPPYSPGAILQIKGYELCFIVAEEERILIKECLKSRLQEHQITRKYTQEHML